MNLKPNKIILDGFWRVGKSTFCKKMELGGWLFILEPDHNKESGLALSPVDLNFYYAISHLSNMLRFTTKKKRVILERCLIASFAYNYAMNNKVWKIIWNSTETSDFLKRNKVYCFYRTYKNFLADMSHYPKNQMIPPDVNLRRFYLRFREALSLVANKYPHNVQLVKLNRNQFVSDYFTKRKDDFFNDQDTTNEDIFLRQKNISKL